MNFYTAAGNIFIQQNSTYIACHCMLEGLSLDEYNSEVWYFLAVALHSQSVKLKDENLVLHSIASFKRSAQLNPKNPYAQKTLKGLANKSYDYKKLVEKVPIAEYDNIIQLKPHVTEEEIVDAFIPMDNENKTAIAMYLGETKNPLYYPLLKYCLLEESDPHVQFAALKRIHHHKSIHDLKSIFITLEEKGVKNYQPYFNIALENIQEDWSNELLKKYKIDSLPETKTKQKYTTEVTQQIQAIFGLSYMQHSYKVIRELYNKRDNATLVYYLTSPLNDEGLKTLLQNNIIDNRGQFTESGWSFVKEYVEKITESSDSSPEKPKTSEKKSDEWWKFWK